MKPLLRFVLVGTGNIAGTYVAAARKVNTAEIVGVVSRDAERARAYASENKIPDFADSLRAIKTDFDAVMVATPNGLHYLTAEEAAAMGKHVLTEKPIDISIEHIDRMISACEKAGVKLGTTYQCRTRPDNKTIKAMLSNNSFGRIYAVDLTVKVYRGQEYYDSTAWRGTMDIDGGGPFMQQASHNIDILRWLFGMPETVYARTGTLAHTGIEVEDHGIAVLGFEDGAIGTIVASTVAKPGFIPRMEVLTERGSFVMENDAITTWEIEGIESPAAETGEQTHSGLTVAVAETVCHEAIIEDLVEAIRNDRDPIVPPHDARCTTELILAIYRSANENKEITL